MQTETISRDDDPSLDRRIRGPGSETEDSFGGAIAPSSILTFNSQSALLTIEYAVYKLTVINIFPIWES